MSRIGIELIFYYLLKIRYRKNVLNKELAAVSQFLLHKSFLLQGSIFTIVSLDEVCYLSWEYFGRSNHLYGIFCVMPMLGLHLCERSKVKVGIGSSPSFHVPLQAHVHIECSVGFFLAV